MATYNQLLIDAGGGVIDRNQQSEQCNDATVAIGIGGTGTDALKKLKEEVYKRLRPDNPDAVVPEYKNIKFFAIDSDLSKVGAIKDVNQLNKNTEYFDISNDNIRAVFNSKEMLGNRVDCKWLDYENITIEDAANGAGGIRQVGRFLIVDKATAFRAKIKSVISSACIGVSGELNIHIFTGLSGGTGSGCFIDVCYIVQSVLEEMGRENAKICGYFFLPDVNLSVPEITADPLISKYIKVNGYTALKELDYLISLEKSNDYFTQEYSSFSIKTQKPPVSLCHLISTTSVDGVILDGGYDYAMSVAVDYVLSYLSKVTFPEGVTVDTNGQTLKGHISNLANATAGILKHHGATYGYSILGASNAEMPLTEIATYLAAELFGKFDDIYDKSPAERDLSKFITDNQFGYEAVLSELTKQIKWNVRFPEYDPKRVVPGFAPAITRCDDWCADALGIMQANKKAMIDEFDGEYRVTENPKALTSRIFNALYNSYCANPEFGPYFAAALLAGDTNKSLINVIDGYIETNTERKNAENRQDSLRKHQLEEAESLLRGAGLLNRTKRIRAYLDALELWYVHLTKIDMYTYMESVLTEFRRQVKGMYDNYYVILCRVLSTLKDTFELNRKNLVDPELQNDATGYTWKILKITDIKDDLDKTVKSLDVENEIREFLLFMSNNYDVWSTEDGFKITRLVAQYMLKKFDKQTQRTILDYLKIKYNTDNNGTLLTNVKNEIFQEKMHSDSSPLFWKSGHFDLSDIALNSVLSIPFNSDVIIKAAEDFASENQEYTVRRTGLLDRMFMMRFYSGVPLYAYQGILELEKAYEADSRPGRHLYEAGEVNWNNYLPSPIPESFKIANHSISRIVERNNKLIDEYNKGVELGIISKENRSVQVLSTPDIDFEKYNADIEACKAKGGSGIRDLQMLLKSMIEYRENIHTIEGIKKISVLNDGAEADRETVLVDNYLNAPVANNIVTEEIAKIEKLDTLIETVKNDVENMVSVGNDQKDFFDALFVGTIKSQKTKTTYSYTEFGANKELVLQDSSMEFGKDFKIYQAYCTYKELSADMKARIKKETTKNIDDMTDEIYNVAVGIQEKHSPDIMGIIYDNASVLRVEQSEVITEFYHDFIKRLNSFIVSYQ